MVIDRRITLNLGKNHFKLVGLDHGHNRDGRTIRCTHWKRPAGRLWCTSNECTKFDNIYKNIRLSMEKIAVSYRYEI